MKFIGRGDPVPASSIVNKIIEGEQLKNCAEIRSLDDPVERGEPRFIGNSKELVTTERQLGMIKRRAQDIIESKEHLRIASSEMSRGIAKSAERPMAEILRRSGNAWKIMLKAHRFDGFRATLKQSYAKVSSSGQENGPQHCIVETFIEVKKTVWSEDIVLDRTAAPSLESKVAPSHNCRKSEVFCDASAVPLSAIEGPIGVFEREFRRSGERLWKAYILDRDWHETIASVQV